MQRIELETPAKPHFIGAWTLPEPKLCDEIVDVFEANSARHHEGVYDGAIDAAIKRSIDLTVNPRLLKQDNFTALRRYMGELQTCFRDYREQWPFLGDFLETTHVGNFNIQKYPPGGHFAGVHSERTSLATLHRILVWMTYLNDVDGGGETVFDHYDLAVKPERGKTLIWPAEWTHAHSGRPVQATKYIVTGWMHFPDTGD